MELNPTFTPDNSIEPLVTDDCDPARRVAAAEEAADFLVRFACDPRARDAFAQNRASCLAGAGLSDDAQKIISADTSDTLLRELKAESAAVLVVVVLETVTTDIVVV